MPKPIEERDLVRALTRGLDVILAFSNHRSRMTLTEVAQATGLSRPTARRLLLTLQDKGYVISDERVFSLTPRVLALGYAYLSSLDLTEIAQPIMEQVVEATREGVALATLDQTDVVYVTRVPTHRITSLSLTTGTRLPAHATSLGHMLLSDLSESELGDYFAKADLAPITTRTITSESALRVRLDRVRMQGWAMVEQELEDGIRSISAPVYGIDGPVIAAIGLSAQTSAVSTTELQERLLPVLRDGARKISEQLGARRP